MLPEIKIKMPALSLLPSLPSLQGKRSFFQNAYNQVMLQLQWSRSKCQSRKPNNQKLITSITLSQNYQVKTASFLQQIILNPSFLQQTILNSIQNLSFIYLYLAKGSSRISRNMFAKCFLSVYMLKSAISFGTIVTLIIGISLLFVLVYAFIISSVTAQIQSDFRNLFILTFFLSSVMMIVSSIAAVYGLLRKKNKFLVFYAITMGVYLISFLLLGIFSTDFPNYLRDQCSKSPQSSSFQIAVNAANSTLCKDECQCYFPSFSRYQQNQRQIIIGMGATNISQINQSSSKNAQNCKTWQNNTYLVTPQLLMIQTFFNCAGWCNVDSNYNLYYLFSDINNGIPQKSCADALVQFFDQFGTILEFSSFLVSGIVFLILCNIFCLCFHPEKSQQYDALKFFRQTLVHKKKKQDTSGTQIFQIKEIFRLGNQ